MKMKLAGMKHAEFGFTSACEEVLDGHSEWIRLTEFVEVDFPELPPEETVQIQLDALEREEQKETARHAAVVSDIEDRRSKLLAITHNPE